MANAIQMPKLSDTMTEGTIRKWLVQEGQKVSAGDPIAEVETDKATLEMEAYESGTILKILVGDGGSAGVGGPIAVIGKAGEDWEAAAGPAAKVLSGPAPAEKPAAPASGAPAPTATPPPGGAKPEGVTAVLMPKLSDTMQEGTIQKWLRAEGDKVKAGDPLAEVETDKATLEMEAYVGGTVLKILVPDGGTAKVGGTIAVIGKAGADWRTAVDAQGRAEEKPHAAGEAIHERQAALPKTPEEQPGRGDKVIWRPPRPVGTDGFESPSERHNEAAMHPMIAPAAYQPGLVAGEILGITYGMGAGLAAALAPVPRREGVRVRATPLARKLAEERGIDLAEVGGSGPGGRIVKADVETARPSHLRAVPPPPPAAAPAAAEATTPAAAPSPAPAPVSVAGQRVPLSQMRKAIARAMAQAKREVPHFYLTLDVDMAAAVALRQQAKAADVAVSPNDLVLRAVAVAAKEVPQVMGVFREEQGVIEVPADVHLGFATALDDGLITPVIRDAGRMSLGELARQVRELAAKARDKKLKPEDYQGATITVSNLGMYDIEHFYAIVNPPQSSIVSVGKLREEPVVKDGQVVVGQRMRLGYSGDHRVVDGAVGARFLQAVKRALENPMKMLLG